MRGAILLSTNIQNIAVFLSALGKEILRFKKFQLTVNVKVRRVQMAWKLHRIRTMIIAHLSSVVRKFFRRILFRRIVNLRVKKMQRASRRIFTSLIYEKFKRYLKDNLYKYLINIKNIQKFIKWKNEYVQHQINYLSTNWDAMII